jgi:hypothetical protein
MAMPTNLLESPPEEIRQLILQYLSEPDLARLARVSRRTRASVFGSLEQSLAAAGQRYQYVADQVENVIAQIQGLAAFEKAPPVLMRTYGCRRPWHGLRRFQAGMTFPTIEAAARHIGAHPVRAHPPVPTTRT